MRVIGGMWRCGLFQHFQRIFAVTLSKLMFFAAIQNIRSCDWVTSWPDRWTCKKACTLTGRQPTTIEDAMYWY
jgi:hypothetical protein